MLISKYQQLKATKTGGILIKLLPWALGYILLFALPLADMHTCELPNGDQIKHRKVYFYSILGDISKIILWHSNANNGPPYSDKSWYVPKEWWKLKVLIKSSLNCENSRVFGDLISLNNKRFIKNNHELVPLTIKSAQSLDGWRGFVWTLTQKERRKQLEEIKNARQKEGFYEGIGAEFAFYDRIDKQRREKYRIDEKLKLGYHSFMGKFNQNLWYEFSFFSGSCDGKHTPCPITAVWQYHSIDGGKTWSKPKVTKDAKLFVIGKTIKEQPGVAKDKGTLKYIGWF